MLKHELHFPFDFALITWALFSITTDDPFPINTEIPNLSTPAAIMLISFVVWWWVSAIPWVKRRKQRWVKRHIVTRIKWYQRKWKRRGRNVTPHEAFFAVRSDL